jgi:hypothetical protein
MAASAALALATTVYGVTCPTVGETLPAGIYVASANGEFWRVNPRKGTGVAEAKLIGALANPAQNFFPTDIAFNDDGSLYGVDGFELFCIDPVNGESVLIGGGEFNPPWQTSLAGKTGSLGQLYGAGEDQLVAISVGSGKGTPLPTDYGPLACGTETGDLVFDLEQDVLYGTVDCVGGGLADRSHLVTVDPSTGKMLQNIGPIVDTTGRPRYGVFGLAFGPDGSLYAGTDVSLLKIDIGSGRSMEDFVILSQTPGETFDRVDGMASRVCEAPPYDADRGRRRTAGQWRQECRDGLDVDLAKFADPIMAAVTDGVVTTACEALHHQQPAPVVAGFGGADQVGAKTSVVQSGLRRTIRGRDIQPKAAGGNGGPDTGMSTLCGLGLRELAAAALNVGSGRVNHACPSCDDGPSGRYLMELADMLQQAIQDDDDRTCNEVKRAAHHLTGDDCD